MTDQLYLFPERIGSNPSSFLSTATMTNPTPVRVDGYRVYALLDWVDEVCHPFWLVPVPSAKKSCEFYRYQFPDGPPDFSSLGLSVAVTKHGRVIFMDLVAFFSTCAGFDPISLSDSHTDGSTVHQLVALMHLDLVPVLTKACIDDNDWIAAVHKRFECEYGFSEGIVHGIDSCLRCLYVELLQMLQLFSFAPPSADSGTFVFGSLRLAMTAFNTAAFPSLPTGRTTVTPASVKQLRATTRFVRLALESFGYATGEGVLGVGNAVAKFRLDRGLSEGSCDGTAMREIWATLIVDEDGVMRKLREMGVALPFQEGHQDASEETQPRVNPMECDKVGTKIAFGLSHVIDIEKVKTPRTVVADVVESIADAVNHAGKPFGGTITKAVALDAVLCKTTLLAKDLQARAVEASTKGEAAMRVIDGISAINGRIRAETNGMKERMRRAVVRTNALGVLLSAVVLVLLVHFFRERAKRE